ncbi:hypothetical protein [Tenacibaculum finnmarkense]|uniref:DUF7738 domain-containing protein n=1 Tax=Tenacibaculum finnmarkense genomovar ulcerans TaxID=2781388 RepID=A0A2I2M8V8_9FLAO|nr:hypothetical protein [Tenacibaculum finnmarkense]ALU75377.1 hypothetical protein AUW17_08905 [Tenacibaculum dicentrarchi]MBE7632779.1 hypothetical protein [Tenacibaculum finnmarkense genomovar ulcerans]MBE7644429.1 hypothetical protein [Tenacibaculum finnmarkense genomovar ulcerans]MBE7648021.1 hypothetical protein [Tenacibaculum finnmarkense genomovar ulcerans]MBE7687989.1 hypothetical protein [Tenacibaculum finnmarkense genomovar ulcerans]
MKFNFFKKKKAEKIIIKCDIDFITINETPITFPTNYTTLVAILGKPERELQTTNHYLFWDIHGIYCSYTNSNHILSINAYQYTNNNIKTKNIYTTKKLFKGELYLNNQPITYSEFGKIPLGKVAIHRLGTDNDFRLGFNLGVNKIYAKK